MTKKFALIGAAGYIAPKHMRAIKDVGGELVVALDPNDSVGILDRYFPNTLFFTEEHRLRRFLDKNPVDYVSICSPNYLHYHHIMLATDAGAEAICEKPLVINPENLEELKFCARFINIHSILQLRYHPVIQEIKSSFSLIKKQIIQKNKYRVVVEYNTYRGPWYHYSWKGDKEKSGGLVMNIGVHLFDMLIHLFGGVKTFRMFKKTPNQIVGRVDLEYAEVYFNLDITKTGAPKRTIEINNQVFDLGQAFENLHTECYRQILDGKGVAVQDTEPALRLVYEIGKLEDIK